ncbi:hypothetical protein NGTWS1702_32560 [Mycolicibacterium cyprinidarum]|uniref:Metallopeptidase DUF4344 n=1 Tax=Mycolicibacterium cyprinidarum TaxID=2860311 RepID=A0ABQ4V461_9MYCO|nr:hypothetical protein NGTWS1702_32560 [Mycolicibacterium sp. NGTWSNA01]
MRTRLVPILAAGLLMMGCTDAQQQPEAPAPSPEMAAPSPPSVSGTDRPGSAGSMIVTYQDAHSPEAITGRTLMQDNELLEDLAGDINQTLNLPYDIGLLGAQCDEANAFWDPDEKAITICYEDAALARQIFTEAGDADPDASALNSEYATFYHEVGHMAINVYELPVTGREEDVADQLAAYLLLEPGEDGTTDPESVQAVKDFARAFGASGAQRTELGNEDFADVHSLDETRMFNLECWIYGSNPEANADLVTDGELPEERASGCQDEWIQLDNAWSTLLDPYFK